VSFKASFFRYWKILVHLSPRSWEQSVLVNYFWRSYQCLELSSRFKGLWHFKTLPGRRCTVWDWTDKNISNRLSSQTWHCFYIHIDSLFKRQDIKFHKNNDWTDWTCWGIIQVFVEIWMWVGMRNLVIIFISCWWHQIYCVCWFWIWSFHLQHGIYVWIFKNSFFISLIKSSEKQLLHFKGWWIKNETTC